MTKTLLFIYGVIAYAIFLVSFLYLVGFVGNIIVPRTIDFGAETPLFKALLINALLLSGFAIQHSIMARPAFKKRWTKIISPVIERSTYVLLSSLTLLFIFWQWRQVTTIIWEIKNDTPVLIVQGIFWLGWLIALLATFMINHFHLFGLNQVFDNLKSKEPIELRFKTNFFYKFVRHPIMTGFIIAFWATPVMTVGHLMFAVITTIYIVIAVKHLEEKDLKNEIGDAYSDYQKKVPMLVPFTKF